MRILSRDNHAPNGGKPKRKIPVSRGQRLCLDALFTAAAMMLSYLETLIPFRLLLPLPGFRLGLANIVVLLVFCFLSAADAAAVSATRILLMGLLFGSATSLFFSAMGGLLSFLVLTVTGRFCQMCSFLGASVLCAAAHNCGQIAAAAILFGSNVIFAYLPVLLVASALYGGITGLVLNLTVPRLYKPLWRRKA